MSQNHTKPKARILFVVNDSWFFVSHRLAIGVQAVKLGHDTHLAALEDYSTEKVVAENINFHNWPVSPRSTNPLKEILSIAQLAKILLNAKPDIVHLVTIKSVLYGGLLARVLRVPSVVFAISGLGYLFADHDESASVFKKMVLNLYRFALGHPNAIVIVQNRNDYQFFIDKNLAQQSQMRLIKGSGVDLSLYSEEHNQLPQIAIEEKNDLPIVFLASRLLWDKGIQTFVDIATRVNATHKQARFLLAGSSDTENPRSVPESTLRQWEKEGIIEWLGHSDNIPELLKQASVFVLPTIYGEGVPKVLIEACAAGVPVVASDWPGCREIITHEKNGFLAPADSVDQLTMHVQNLINNPELAKTMGDAGRKTAQSEFDVKQVVAATVSIYNELVLQRSPK